MQGFPLINTMCITFLRRIVLQAADTCLSTATFCPVLMLQGTFVCKNGPLRHLLLVDERCGT